MVGSLRVCEDGSLRVCEYAEQRGCKGVGIDKPKKSLYCAHSNEGKTSASKAKVRDLIQT